MNFDTVALWTGRIFIISLLWILIFIIWYYTITRLWNAHQNLMLTRKFALIEQPKLFTDFLMKNKKKKEVVR